MSRPEAIYFCLIFIRDCIIQHLTDINTKQMCRYASLYHNIYIAADPTPGDVDHAAHDIAFCAHNVYTANHEDPPTSYSFR